MREVNKHIPALFSIIVHAPCKSWTINIPAYCQRLGVENDEITRNNLERAIRYIYDLGIENFPNKRNVARILSAYAIKPDGNLWIQLADSFFEILRSENAYILGGDLT